MGRRKPMTVGYHNVSLRPLLLVLPLLFPMSACDRSEPLVPLHSAGVFHVEGNKPYLRTGLDLVPETYYLFRHTGGTVCIKGEQRCAPPRGSDLPGDEAWGLQLVIGDELVQVRDGLVVSVESNTPLVFYVPDGEEIDYSEEKNPYYEDNKGYWDIEVLVFSHAPEEEWLRGVSITSYSNQGYCSPRMEELLKKVQSLGANAVQYVMVYETDGLAVFPAEFSPLSFCMAQATRIAHDLGLKVAWNLHVDPRKNSEWRGALQPGNREAFFESYGHAALFFAGLAQNLGVEFFLPATEMVSLTKTPEDRNRWLSMFLKLHTVFFGKIIYAADQSEFSGLEAAFWSSCCDAVGITPWYSLTTDPHPTAEVLKKAWERPVAEMERYADEVKMPIYLAEGPGYRAIEACATEPAEYVEKGIPNDLCQIEAYKAYLEVFSKQARRQRFLGTFLWEIRAPGEEAGDYSPLDRLTQSVIEQAWKETN
jgi:hypothetical protein